MLTLEWSFRIFGDFGSFSGKTMTPGVENSLERALGKYFLARRNKRFLVKLMTL